MNKLKKFIAILLSVTILMSMTTIAVSANEISSEANAEVTTDDYSISGSNSMGNLIADALNASENDIGTQYLSCITDVEVVGPVATVKYTAVKDCTILVALYDENTDRMLASGKASALAEKETVDITIETKRMPEAYVLKAYMLDKNYAPIANVYTDMMHTTAMLELLAMTVNDFEEEEILNLDENEKTNFGVYNKDVIKFSMNNSQNILKSYDEAKGVYVFSNASKELLNLTAGDIVVCDDDTDNIIIIKVKSISVDDTTVTITEDETSLDEVFDHLKIESSQNSDDPNVKKTHIDNTKSKVSQSVGAPLADGDNEENNEENYDIVVEDDDDDDFFDYFCGVSVDLGVDFNMYVTLKSVEIEFKVTPTVSGIIELEGSMSEEVINYPKKTVSFEFSPIACVTIEFEPKVILSFKGTFKAEFSIKGEVGFKGGVTKDKIYVEKIHNMKFESSISAEVELFIGLELAPDFAIAHEKIAEFDVSVIVGGSITATAKKDLLTTEDTKHSCNKCISAEIKGVVTMEAKLVFLGEDHRLLEKITISVSVLKGFYSHDYKTFNLGECPYKDYLMTITVKDINDNPVKNATVKYHTGDHVLFTFGTTNSKGEVKRFLPLYELGPAEEPEKILYCFQAEKDNETYYSASTIRLDYVPSDHIIFGDHTEELKIKAVDTNGKPIEDAEVLVSYIDGNFSNRTASGVTDVNGLCTLSVDNNYSYDVCVNTELDTNFKNRTIYYYELEFVHTFECFNGEVTTQPNTQPLTEPTEPTTEPVTIIASGTCGKNAIWTLDENYCLTISGGGLFIL